MDVIQSFLRSDKPIQYIRYLENEVDPTCPEFKEYAKVLIETFDPVLYDNLHEGHATEMGHFFLKTANPELSLVFIKRVLSAEKWCLDQDGQMTHVNRKFIELFAELIKSIPWEDIKETLDFTLDHLDFSLIPGWLEVYKHTQISYIAHKVISRGAESKNGIFA
uniref:Uncharacterized protein n=1 Tax=Clytia hemisphaerica TaxID=252671 RepID=A0A7M5XL97_9CNID